MCKNTFCCDSVKVSFHARSIPGLITIKHMKYHLQIECVEAQVMFKVNKTGDWLLNEENRKNRVKAVMKEARNIKHQDTESRCRRDEQGKRRISQKMEEMLKKEVGIH